MSQLNLSHGNRQLKSVKTEKLKIKKKRICSEVTGTGNQGDPGKTGMQDIIRRALKDVELTCGEASELAHSRSSWRQRVVSSARDELRSHVKDYRTANVIERSHK